MKMSMPLETGSVGIVYRIFAAGAQLRELVTAEVTVAALLEALLKKSTIDNFHASHRKQNKSRQHVALLDQIQIQT